MRRFIFTAKNIGRERYLTYTMGEGMDVDEDVLDYCEDNEMPEVLDIIYEEDDDFDYLTYDVTGLTSLETYTQNVINREKVFKILRNVSLGMISIKEYALPLSYIILNKGYMYINEETLDIQFLYLPVEGEASVSTEFKSFVRQLMAGMKYDVDEDVSYVGQLLTYINGDSFNLRGLIGLTEAMMQDAGISYSEEESIATEDGAEIVDNVATEEEDNGPDDSTDVLRDLQGEDGKLPEIGDDEEDDIDLEAVEAAIKEEETKTAAKAEEEKAAKVDEAVEEIEGEPDEPVHEGIRIKTEREQEHTESIEDIKARLNEIVGTAPKKPSKGSANESNADSKPVRVSRVAMLKAAEEAIEEEDAAAAEAEAEESNDKKASEKKDSKKDSKKDAAKKDSTDKKEPAAKKDAVIDNTILGSTGTLKINPYLIRVNTEERIMINKPVFKIGKASRGVDYRVNGNGAISRQHAIILHKGDEYFIKDNKSTNHTYVNDVEVKDEEEVALKDNSKIKLGDAEFIFKVG